MRNFKNKKSGYFLIQILIFGAISMVVISGLISFAVANSKLSRRSVLSEQAFEMAEAGLEYYRWHLAHAPSDYTDGTGGAGPYVKNFYDRNNVLLGTYTLTITAPPPGSTLVTIKSVGISAVDPNTKRAILAKLAIPSFGNFALASNSNSRFGEGTEVFGPIHSNGGIRFDGLAHNIVTSALTSYNDPDNDGNNEFGVHTHIKPPPLSGIYSGFVSAEAPNNPVPVRTDVFIAGRSFPAPILNFASITNNLTQIKTDAVASGKYIGPSNDDGYKIVLKTNDTFDVYKVNTLISTPNYCDSPSWSVNKTTFSANYSIPANGLVFVEDNIWVEGQINTARITIVAAKLPDNASTRKSVTVNNNLLYTNYDGQDVVALIGQENVNTGMVSADTLRIDAALFAQNGRVGRFHYNSNCNQYDDRSTLTLYGTVISALRYGFAYTDGTGYNIRNLIYDASLLYGAPPSFPTTTNFYQVIYWKEI